jgi:DNA modification methylase
MDGKLSVCTIFLFGGTEMELKIEYLPIKALKPYEKNTRKHQKKDVDNIARSIEKYGMCDAIGIWSDDNIIVEGHGRMLACKQLGMTEVPCVRLDHLTDEQRREYAIAHNATAELSEWDLDILPDELAELDLSDFDFDFGIEDEEEETEIVEDEAPEVDEENEPITKLGDIWQLGRHRLMCGDSTDKETVELLMNGNKADMVFTDPPYLMGFEGNVHADGSKSFNAKHGAIKNDKMSREDGDKFILSIFENIKEFNKGAYYVCFYRLGLDYIFRALDELNNRYKALIIWDKGNHTLSNSDYMSKYEPIVYGWFDSHLFYGNRSNFDIWNIQRTQKNDLHPTMKPIALCAKAIENSSKKEDIVLDFFGGSGSTLIASEQLNRKCYAMELDPKYCDVIIKRWEDFTGEKAVLLNDSGSN